MNDRRTGDKGYKYRISHFVSALNARVSPIPDVIDTVGQFQWGLEMPAILSGGIEHCQMPKTIAVTTFAS
jgi:hypothetical protein